MTTTPEAPFFFRGPEDLTTGSGANFQMTFPNGLTVSLANTSMAGIQRIEVAIKRDGEIINHDEIESFVTPARVLAIMLETALRTDHEADGEIEAAGTAEWEGEDVDREIALLAEAVDWAGQESGT